MDRAGCRPVPSTTVASAPGHAPSSTAGLVEEAVALRERFDPELSAFSAIGYREAWAVADGSTTVDAAVEADARRNVAFAKRQRTWFRAEPDVTWVDATGDDPLPTALAVTHAILGRP